MSRKRQNGGLDWLERARQNRLASDRESAIDYKKLEQRVRRIASNFGYRLVPQCKGSTFFTIYRLMDRYNCDVLKSEHGVFINEVMRFLEREVGARYVLCDPNWPDNIQVTVEGGDQWPVVGDVFHRTLKSAVKFEREYLKANPTAFLAKVTFENISNGNPVAAKRTV